MCYYIESILGSPEETAENEFLEGDVMNTDVGTERNGQGHETAYVEFRADEAGLSTKETHAIRGEKDLRPESDETGGHVR